MALNPRDDGEVNAATGSYSTAFTDLSMPGFDNPFAWTRVYNSADATVGDLGPGWQYSYGAMLTINPTSGDVTARAGDAQQLLFVKQADGSYQPTAGATAELVRNAGGDYTLTRDDQATLSFSAAGRLTGIGSPNNHPISLAYDGAGKLDTISDAAGRLIDVSWNAGGTRISQFTLADGRHVDFSYDASGRLQTVSDLRGKVTTYAYDGTSSRLASIKDANQHWVVRNTYDASTGRLTSRLDPLGNQTSYAWNASTQTATITDPLAKVWTKTFRNNLLIADSEPNAGSSSHAYDEDLNQVGATDAQGVETRSSYDLKGNLVGQRNAAGSSGFSYNAQRRLTGETDVQGHTTAYSYDAQGNQTRAETTNGRAVSAVYNAAGLASSQTDARGKTTTFTYDTQGNKLSQTTPEGNKTTWTYDAYGRVTTVVKPRGNVSGANPDHYKTSYSYDAGNNKLSETNELGRTTSYSNDDVGNLASLTNALNKSWSYEYDEANRRTKETAPNSAVTQSSYDARGNLTAETDPLGNKTMHGYDAANRRVWTVSARGNVAGCNCAEQYKTRYRYDPAGRLVREIDPYGAETLHSYDALGRETTLVRKNYSSSAASSYASAISADNPSGYWKLDEEPGAANAADASGNNHPSTSVTSADFGQMGAFGGSGSATLQTGTISGPLFLSATANWTLEAWVKPAQVPSNQLILYNGASGSNGYGIHLANASGCSSGSKIAALAGGLSCNAAGGGHTVSAGTWYHVVLSRDATTFRLYVDGVLRAAAATSATLPTGSWKIGQGFSGQLDEVAFYSSALSCGTTTVGAACTTGSQIGAHYAAYTSIVSAAEYGQTRTLSEKDFDAAGRVLSDKNAAGKTRSFGYDIYGQRTSVTDERAKTTTFDYDANGNTTAMTSPLGNKQTFGYDGDNRKIWEVSPRGNLAGANPDDYRTLYTYDADGQLTRLTTPLGHETDYGYDRVGRKTFETDANEHTTSWEYDELGRLKKVIDARLKETVYGYDDVSNLTSRTDAKGRVTNYSYELDKRLTQFTAPGPNVGDTRVWTYEYDAEGHRSKKTDAKGNATSGDPNDGITTWSYDRLGRPTGIDYADSTPDVTWSYDGWGNRASMADGQPANETYSYDPLNRLTVVTRGSDTFAYEYDDAGNLTKRTYPDSTVIEYSYDDDNRMSTVKVGGATIATYGWNADALLTSTTLPAGNGYVETRSYDRSARLNELTNSKNGTDLSRFTYTRDPVGNPTRIDKVAAAAERYSYDELDRLTEVCYQTAACTGGSDPFIRWTYDELGNRLTEERPAGTTTYSYDRADQLTSETTSGTTTNYSYDDNGNQTAKGGRTFTYDLADRFASTSTAGTTINYGYDGDSKRLSAADGSTTNRYLWDRNGALPELVLERDGTGTLLRRYHHGLDLLSMRSGGNDFYYHPDGLGSIVNLTDAAGATQWTYEYEPYGTARTATNATGAPVNPMRYTGEHLDAATGLYHLRARQYDPPNGRFLTADPIPAEVTDPYVATYLYVGNMPTLLTDPSGRTPSYELNKLEREYCFGSAWYTPKGISRRAECKTVANAQVDARNITARLAQLGTWGFPIGEHDGPADAFRHCCWSGLITLRLGADTAKGFTDRHEFGVPIPPRGKPGSRLRKQWRHFFQMRQMDLHNNTVGRRLAAEARKEVPWTGGPPGLLLAAQEARLRDKCLAASKPAGSLIMLCRKCRVLHPDRWPQ